jgi:hypothetical protein
MKKLAARDFEDLLQVCTRHIVSVKKLMCSLQCSMPAFEGLFPAEYDQIVQDLLFDLSAWHAFAKMRLHTDSTLAFFEIITTSLGRTLRQFAADVCGNVKTFALPREEEATQRRAAKAASKASSGPPLTTEPIAVRAPACPCRILLTYPQLPAGVVPSEATASSTGTATARQADSHAPMSRASAGAHTKAAKVKSGRRERKFNLSTYKLHALGDYPKTIRRYGTTDNYSTQPVRCRPSPAQSADLLTIHESGRTRTSTCEALLQAH